MTAPFWARVFGFLPIYLATLVAGLYSVACAFVLRQPEGPIMVLVLLGLALVTIAQGARRRVKAAKAFRAQWDSAAGVEHVARRGWLARNFWCVAAFAAWLCTGYFLLDWFDLHPDEPVTVPVGILALLSLTLLLIAIGLLLRRPVAAQLAARRRRQAAPQELDGKPLPPHFVQPALPAPRHSPDPAWFTQDLPDYCTALLQRSAKPSMRASTS